MLGQLTTDENADVVAAVGALCDFTAQAEVAAAFEPRAAEITDGAAAIARTLAAIASVRREMPSSLAAWGWLPELWSSASMIRRAVAPPRRRPSPARVPA